VRPLPPTITGNVGCIEETKPLDVTCTSTGSRPRATLQWTIGQKDVTSYATEWSNHINATDTMNNLKHHSLDAHVRIKSTEFLKCMYKTKKNLTISVIKLLLLVSNCVQLTFNI
jgi:hypothetical protein